MSAGVCVARSGPRRVHHCWAAPADRHERLSSVDADAGASPSTESAIDGVATALPRPTAARQSRRRPVTPASSSPRAVRTCAARGRDLVLGRQCERSGRRRHQDEARRSASVVATPRWRRDRARCRRDPACAVIGGDATAGARRRRTARRRRKVDSAAPVKVSGLPRQGHGRLGEHELLVRRGRRRRLLLGHQRLGQLGPHRRRGAGSPVSVIAAARRSPESTSLER